MSAFANITSGLGTGTHKDTPGPSSESLDSTPAMLESTPATLESTPATLEPTPVPVMLEPTLATLDPQPVPETSTVHLIHVMATCRFFFFIYKNQSQC